MSNNVGTTEISLNCPTCDADYVAAIEFDFADYNGNGIVDVEITEADCKCEPHFNGDVFAIAEEAFLESIR